MNIELHSTLCSCRGGSWVLLEGAPRSPCRGRLAEIAEKLTLSLEEWKQYGKPGSVEAYREIQDRLATGERREYQRFEVSLPVRLARIANWRQPTSQTEETMAEVVAAGGALVRSRMALDKGETIHFSVGESFHTRAEVMYVSLGSGPGMDGIQRLGLKFLDAALPAQLIPADARPLR